MARPIHITWSHTAEELHTEYRSERDGRVKVWLQALWRVCAGENVVIVADSLGVSDRAVHTWLNWYRRGGLPEVRRHRKGRQGGKSKLNAAQEEQLKQYLNQDIVHTAIQIGSWLKQRFGIEYSKDGLYLLLKRMGIRKKAPRVTRKKNLDSEPQAAKKKVYWSANAKPIS